jgi:hypothetical protein
MTTYSATPDWQVNNSLSLHRLERAIAVAGQEFSLILACCNSIPKQQQITTLLTTSSTLDIQVVNLSPETTTLYTTINDLLGETQPAALIINGLDAVVEINQLLLSTNFIRDEFPKRFHCPIVVWVNDEILTKLVWLAPDFKNWAATTIRFELPVIQPVCLGA